MIKTKVKLKTKLNKNSSDVNQQMLGLGVLIENVNDNVQLIAEQYGDIKENISSLKKDVGEIKQTLKSHTETLKSHTEIIGKLAVDFTIVKEDIAFIKGGLKKKVDIDEFIALERRVVLLEKCR